jgi:hypothetical protein
MSIRDDAAAIAAILAEGGRFALIQINRSVLPPQIPRSLSQINAATGGDAMLARKHAPSSGLVGETRKSQWRSIVWLWSSRAVSS